MFVIFLQVILYIKVCEPFTLCGIPISFLVCLNKGLMLNRVILLLLFLLFCKNSSFPSFLLLPSLFSLFPSLLIFVPSFPFLSFHPLPPFHPFPLLLSSSSLSSCVPLFLPTSFFSFFLFFPSSFFPSLLPLLIYPFSFSFCSNFLLTRILT